TTVIYGHEAANMYFTGTTINIYHTDVSTEWVGQVGRIVVVDRLKPWFQIWWTVGIGGKGQFLDGFAFAGGTLDEETSRLPFKVIFADFQQIGRYLLCLVTYFACR